MIKTVCFFVIIILLSCSYNSHDKTKPQEKPKDSFTIDTLLNNYQTKIRTDQSYFRKGIENRFNIQISNVSKDDIVIYTKTSEATLSENKSEYLIHPTSLTDSVTIHVNIKHDGHMIMIGKIRLKTK